MASRAALKSKDNTFPIVYEPAPNLSAKLADRFLVSEIWSFIL